jgi:LysM repeat protein
MTKQQAIFIIVINACISFLISLAVVFLMGRPEMPVAPQPLVSAGPTAEVLPVEATSSPTPVIYIVRAGDTLSSIAARFNVPLGDLMRANGLTNADFLQIGQELIIPVGGLPPVTPTFTAVPTPTDTPLPFEPPTSLPTGAVPPAIPAATSTPLPTPATAQPLTVRISEIMAAGRLSQEAVVLFNEGLPVRLDGWTLSSKDGKQYTFPSLFLGAAGSVRVHTGPGQDSSTDLYWGQAEAVWAAPGTVVTLRDNTGKVVDSYKLP